MNEMAVNNKFLYPQAVFIGLTFRI